MAGPFATGVWESPIARGTADSSEKDCSGFVREECAWWVFVLAAEA